MIDPQNQLVTVKAEKLSLYDFYTCLPVLLSNCNNLFFSLNESVCCRIRFIANKYASLLTKYDADGTSNNISDVYLEVFTSNLLYLKVKLYFLCIFFSHPIVVHTLKMLHNC